MRRVHLSDFNDLDDATARDLVRVWAAVPSWVDGVVSARPYASIDTLTTHAADLAKGWGRAELEQALSQHPRIGEKPDPAVAAAIATGNAEYEARFDRVFLVRAAGRTPEQILRELQRRLGNDDDTEVREACEQLAEIALLRLRGAVGHKPI